MFSAGTQTVPACHGFLGYLLKVRKRCACHQMEVTARVRQPHLGLTTRDRGMFQSDGVDANQLNNLQYELTAFPVKYIHIRMLDNPLSLY
jgi:hypothetical protein